MAAGLLPFFHPPLVLPVYSLAGFQHGIVERLPDFATEFRIKITLMVWCLFNEWALAYPASVLPGSTSAQMQ